MKLKFPVSSFVMWRGDYTQKCALTLRCGHLSGAASLLTSAFNRFP